MTSRTIKKIVPATKTGKITRMIGTLDIDGSGTNHPLESVDPFILLDHGVVPINEMPPFGAHPHRGHSVITVLLQGKVKSWDSFKPKDEWYTLTAPASYWVDAGSGVFHDERSVIDNADDATQHIKLFQLWVGVKESERSNPPKVQKDENLECYECKDAGGNVVGRGICYVGRNSPISTPHPVEVRLIKQLPKTTYRVPIDSKHSGFVVHVNGAPRFAGTSPNKDLDVLVLDECDDTTNYLEVITCEEEAEYLVCTGEPINEKWVKKLTANGAIIAATEDEARSLVPSVDAMSAAGKVENGSFAPWGL
jgi:redox-sensitive bicupin YhaK (pirin superfamily)